MTTLAIALTFGVFVTILVRDGTILDHKAIEALGPNGGLQKISLHVTALTSRLGLSPTDLQAKARTAIEGATSRAAGVLILGPVLMTMAIAILRIYRDEERVRKHAERP